MKPFDLEAAKAGAPVCTRDGHSARIICWYTKNTNDYPIVALVNFPESDGERVGTYNLNGRYVGGCDSKYDLFMAEEEHYDVSNFKPFDKVLVRDTDDGYWKAGIYSHRSKDQDPRYSFSTAHRRYIQCIPYNEETAHLIGTTEMPPKKYINW